MVRKLSLLSALVFGFLQVSAQDKNDNVLQYIDPKIGGVGWLLEPTRPTVQLPNQMIRVYPQRADYIDDQISSFPLNIVSHRLGEVFAIKPTVNAVTANEWSRKLTYDHDLEITRPWYLSTYLIDDDMTVEFSPAKKTGIYRFTYPATAKNKALLLSLYNDEGSFSFSGGNTLQGTEVYHDNIKVYVYGRFNVPGEFGTLADGQINNESSVTGKNVKAFVKFNSKAGNMVIFKYAISYVSAEQAINNFNSEIKSATFESVEASAEKHWQNTIGKIQVEGGTKAQKRSFYTAIYRCNERMVDITEDRQYYSGYDNQVHKTDRPFYVDDWTWDTYLALHPLRAILNPAMEEDMLNSYVKMYEQSGWMPTFPVLFGDNPCMNGFHSTIMFLDDYRKGLRNYDIQKAYDGMLKNATQATMLPWRNGPKIVLDDFYYQHGFYPALQKGEKETVTAVHPFEKRQAVAVTLGASYDDWALGQLAADLNKTADTTLFNKRASNYKNLWSNKAGMFIPKDSSGKFIDIDPKFDGGLGGRDYYDENNGYTYMWQVQHDIGGLINLMGGKKGMENKLDSLFREPLGRSRYSFWSKFPDATGLVGQFSMGNEPSFHIPYLYNYAGAPWKTQKHIRLLLDLWYKDNVFGIPGDEDGGGMSAFVVFSSMGFYPVTPGLPVYTIGSPLFSKVTISLPNGKVFKMIANNCSVVNKYIQSAKLNGKPLNQPLFTHQQLIDGGVVELEMGPKPNKAWGVN